jgi:L-seryl-tRNA(Ser) seleniumtransferase
MARAVRLDKTSIAGLAATLLHYLRGEALTKVPVWRMIAAPPADLERRAHRWARACRRAGLPARVVEGRSMVGGGSLPEESLPTRLLALGGDGSLDVEALARRLRTGDPPLLGRIEQDTLLLDPRTVDPRQDRILLKALLHTALAAALR